MESPVRQGADSRTALLPYFFLAALPAGFGMDHLLPLPFQVAQIENQLAHKLVPALLILVSLVFLVTGVRSFPRTKSSVPENQHGQALGTAGFQDWTQSSVCLGILLLSIGIGVAVQSPWIMVLALLPAIFSLRRYVTGPAGPNGYGRQSPSIYDRLHGRFLRISGGEGQSAVEGAVSALLRPDLAILDAGCGTGQLARRLLRQEPGLELTLLDQSERLLRAASDLPVTRIRGDLTNLPLEDELFDLTLAFWSIEATGDLEAAISELTRVTRPSGHICLLFCARTDARDTLDRLMEWGIRIRGTGRFLEPQAVVDALQAAGARHIRRLACRGPAAALLAKKSEAS